MSGLGLRRNREWLEWADHVLVIHLSDVPQIDNVPI
jgi:hypothetical protein